jgi:hypothetical protein
MGVPSWGFMEFLVLQFDVSPELARDSLARAWFLLICFGYFLLVGDRHLGRPEGIRQIKFSS